MDIIEFKSNEEHYYAEEDDLKNHTERYIELGDPRIKILQDYCRSDFENELAIKITLSGKKDRGFIRDVRHVTRFMNMWIITWEPSA